MKTRKILALAAVALLPLTVTACTTNDPTPPAAEAPADPVAPEDTSDVDDLTLVESAFGQHGDYWWYVIVVDNPNDDVAFASDLVNEIRIEAQNEAGTIVASASHTNMILPGRVALAGMLTDTDGEAVHALDVRIHPAAQSDLIRLEDGETFGELTVSDLEHTVSEHGWNVVTATASNTFDEDFDMPSVTLIARNPDGTITQANVTMIEHLPAGGTAEFEGVFLDDSLIPEGATFEMFIPHP